MQNCLSEERIGDSEFAMKTHVFWFLHLLTSTSLMTDITLSAADVESPSITSAAWGSLPSGEEVTLYTLRNGTGMEVRIADYGCTIVSLTVPDRDGIQADVVLGFDSLEGYLGKNPFFGCIAGRYANRIGGASFELDGVRHEVTANSGKHQLHGGKMGFDKRLWKGTMKQSPDRVELELRYTSPAGEEGFPGTLESVVTYRLGVENALEITYAATTDAPTVVNLTNHSYFNLAGEGSGSILDHELQINSTHFTATDDALIPTGKLEAVEGSPLDFRKPMAIGKRIGEDDAALKQGKGYDHNFVVDGEGMRLAARVREPRSGRVLEVHSTQPGVQLYTGNHLNGLPGKGGHTYPKRSGFCLETQHYPDSPNRPEFPSTILRPGENYKEVTVFKFLTD